jgi:hypothetical protein
VRLTFAPGCKADSKRVLLKLFIYTLYISLTRIIHEALEPAALRRGGHAIFRGVGDAVVEV